MNEMKRRAIVWDTIERIAFRPSSNDDRNTWLGIYAKTLHKFWGMDPMCNHFGSNDVFDIPFLDLKCKYKIENAEKYSLSLRDSSNSRRYWQSNIDSEYLSKASLHSVSGRYPHQQRAHLQKEIEAVLDGMFFHPRCHCHLEYMGGKHVQLDLDRGGLSSHEVRRSTGFTQAWR